MSMDKHHIYDTAMDRGQASHLANSNGHGETSPLESSNAAASP
jgi:hypothetical protein